MKYVYLRSQDIQEEDGFQPPTYHVPVFRFLYVLKGKGTVTFNDTESYKIKAGDIMLNSPNKRAISFAPGQEVHLYVVNFTAPDHWMKRNSIHFKDRGRIYDFLKSILEDLVLGNYRRKENLLNIAIDLFIESGAITDAGNRLVQDIAFEIRSNPQSNYVVSELSKSAGCSESYFRVLFRKEIGMSPKEYIKKCKMDYALRLLRDEKRKVKDVAEILGYNDIYEFSKQFKTVFGKSPSKLVKRKGLD